MAADPFPLTAAIPLRPVARSYQRKPGERRGKAGY
jgi:hypothetical protein